MTAYAFIPTIQKDGHKGIVVTSANSATGRALLELARIKTIPTIGIVRTRDAQKECTDFGFENILISSDDNFAPDFQSLADELCTTAVFDGVGGELITRIAPALPVQSTIYFYGFLAGAETFSIQSRILLERNLSLRGYSNFMTETVQNQALLIDALNDLSTVIEKPVFRTKVGKRFRLEEVNDALKYQAEQGNKGILLPQLA